MQDLKKTTPKKPKKQYANQNTIEALGGIFGELKDSLVNDLGKGTANSFKDAVVKDLATGGINEAWDELLNVQEPKSESNHGELSEGTELNLEELYEKTVEVTEMGREYSSEVIHAGKRAQTETSREIQVKMQEILIEIRKISESSKEIKDEIDVITLEQVGDNPGVYHLNLYEQILSKIQDLRLSLDDSLAWFKALRSKNASRQYGVMAKKHGTSYTLSGERQVSTQVG